MLDRLRDLVGRPDRRHRDHHRRADGADRAVWIRSRLDALDRERWELLADEAVPGRKQRLDAVTGAQDDLRCELSTLEAR